MTIATTMVSLNSCMTSYERRAYRAILDIVLTGGLEEFEDSNASLAWKTLLTMLKYTDLYSLIRQIDQSFSPNDSNFVTVKSLVRKEFWIQGINTGLDKPFVKLTATSSSSNGSSDDNIVVDIDSFVGLLGRILVDLLHETNYVLDAKAVQGQPLSNQILLTLAELRRRLEESSTLLELISDKFETIGKKDILSRQPSNATNTTENDSSSDSDEHHSDESKSTDCREPRTHPTRNDEPIIVVKINWEKVLYPARQTAKAAKCTAKVLKQVTNAVVIVPTVAVSGAVAYAVIVTIDEVVVKPVKFTAQTVHSTGKAAVSFACGCAKATGKAATKLYQNPGRTIAHALIPKSTRKQIIEALKDDGSSMAPQN